ncbi:K+ transport (Trk) system, membrane component [Deferribacter desulfuricans SSM1]|uniref:K+ transport (Trk) system, membrane component n=1 Tax=Deferribacter desulfuricans (strain DSM 14783 / JCM 11476 / NBRC 101012 / SSM1) TaxID=639282 RepID=D3PBS9_DEFDS|nr:potassium transporter TrkG [Deferribacter desulfuricans]BAI80052.1 K+ transport (Trk) system, membrane component [Deferribacter desulfuricans SSM1]
MKKIKLSPWTYLILTFLILIFVGSILLKLKGTYNGNLSYIDALFTSTSAVCVTGLIVTNTSNFTLFGQSIILLLIQLGALGIMTLSSSLYIFLRGELGLDQRIMVAKITDVFALHEVENILVYIIKYTFIIELIGAILLSVGFLLQGFHLSSAVYYGIFHSISAFCNAGFSTFDDSLINSNAIVKITTMCLIILGGIGYYVIYDLQKSFQKKVRLKLHTKVVLMTTFLLIIVGFLVFSIIEKEMGIVDGFFQSVTARTAGFNSVDLGQLHNISKFMLIILMIIGASPGSTGGGVKTTTFFIAFVSILRVIKGENKIIIFKRQIPYQTILRAFALIFLYLAVDVVSTLILLYFYNYDFLEMLFEVTSALSTVGLSLGITTKLTMAGKIVIICCMFLGRVGPAALVMAMLGKEKRTFVQYPEEKVVLG